MQPYKVAIGPTTDELNFRRSECNSIDRASWLWPDPALLPRRSVGVPQEIPLLMWSEQWLKRSLNAANTVWRRRCQWRVMILLRMASVAIEGETIVCGKPDCLVYLAVWGRLRVSDSRNVGGDVDLRMILISVVTYTTSVPRRTSSPDSEVSH